MIITQRELSDAVVYTKNFSGHEDDCVWRKQTVVVGSPRLGA